MTPWTGYPWWATAAGALWGGGAVAAWRCRGVSRLSVALTGAGLVAMAAFITLLWASSGRPPMQSMADTRLWYALFLVFAGWITYMRWHYRWMPALTAMMAGVFVIINLVRPELRESPVMAARRSPWYVPHVTLYMLSYALLACALLTALAARHRQQAATDRLVYAGLAFFTLGMLTGALWAGEAWGSCWSWDPKETWAAATWGVYLLYVHLRLRGVEHRVVLTGLLILGFLCMQMCWWGAPHHPSPPTRRHADT